MSPYLSTYCATKAAATFFSQALHYELKGRVDVMAFDCGGVVTKANPFQFGNTLLTPQQAAQGCFRDIGRESRTWGHFRTELEGAVISRLPTGIFSSTMKDMCDRVKY